jgi:hypothetical protein
VFSSPKPLEQAGVERREAKTNFDDFRTDIIVII